jgi:hypothetical protein
MTVTAPPRPPRHSDPVERDDFLQPSDPVERDDPEALIEEARQRARRRRRLYVATAAALALVGGLLFVFFGGPGPSPSVASEPPAQPVATPADEATVVAQFAEYGVGSVFVYEDGRVLLRSGWASRLSEEGAKAFFDYYERLSPESREYAADFPATPLLERRLTADGLGLVESGAVPASAFLRAFVAGANQGIEWKGGASLPAGLWAEPEFRTYEPSRYAFCPHGGDVTRALRRQPAAVRKILRGRERMTPVRFLDPVTELECFEVSATEASVLRELSGFFRMPILPHGESLLVDPSLAARIIRATKERT